MFNSKEGFTVMLRFLVKSGMSQSEAYFSLTGQDEEACRKTIESHGLDIPTLLAMVDILNYIEESGFAVVKPERALERIIKARK